MGEKCQQTPARFLSESSPMTQLKTNDRFRVVEAGRSDHIIATTTSSTHFFQQMLVGKAMSKAIES